MTEPVFREITTQLKRESAETIVTLLKENLRTGFVYYRTRLYRQGPDKPFLLATSNYKPGKHEIFVGEYGPTATADRLLSDLALAIHRQPVVEPKPENLNAIKILKAEKGQLVETINRLCTKLGKINKQLQLIEDGKP